MANQAINQKGGDAVTLIRKKKCKHCKTPFQPFNTLQKWCSPDCGVILAKEALAKKKRKEITARKEALKTRQDHLREAQAAFNAYIRERDNTQACISCGRFHQGQWHAGHYRSVGACSTLRFDERNVWRQCAPCNNHKSGNITEYRIELIRRIGEDQVTELECTNPLYAWTIEEAKEIKATYKKKLKILKASGE